MRSAYLFSEYLSFLDELKSFGIAARILSDWPRRGIYIVHDIHHRMEVCARFAEEEAIRGLRSTHFIMPLSPHNRKWFDTPEMWGGLKKIQDYDCEIGLHVDPFDFSIIEASHPNNGMRIGFYNRVAAWRGFFQQHGYRMKVANLHGNSKYVSSGMISSDFFKETARDRRVLNGYTESPFWNHYGRYSLGKLKFNTFLALVVVRKKWNPGLQFPDFYLSDNSNQFILHKTDQKAQKEQWFVDFGENLNYLKQSKQYSDIEEKMVVTTDKWMLDKLSINRILETIKSARRTVALVHPQWFSDVE